jgi:hypothetical protein
MLRYAAPLLLLLVTTASASAAVTLKEYQQRVQSALGSLDLIREGFEGVSQDQRMSLIALNLERAREALPTTIEVENDGAILVADNVWLHEALDEFAKAPRSEDNQILLQGILDRLSALAERLDEVQKQTAEVQTKGELRQRLATILGRPEFAREAQEKTAWERFKEWLARFLLSLFPRRSERAASSRSPLTVIAQILVVALALGGCAYALSIFLPQILRRRGPAKKKIKDEPRIVLGERIEPEQSASDLLAAAEALARAGDLRGAIRKGYIALLVELADRKVFSLEQHKTNRDYLRAVQYSDRLRRPMVRLTDSFERHWYGLTTPDANDWVAFRAGFNEAVGST